MDSLQHGVHTALPPFNPGKSRVAAVLACATLWTLGQGIEDGYCVEDPSSKGTLHVGQVTGASEFAKGEELPHGRPVSWHLGTIARNEMSAELQR